MSRIQILVGTDNNRLVVEGLGKILPAEIHATTDHKRLFFENSNLLSGSVWHGEVADESAMVALNSTSGRGCFPMDYCKRADTSSIWLCVSNRGTSADDWIEVGGGGAKLFVDSGAPDSGLGSDGDTYIDATAHDFYGPKASGSWGSPTSLIGPQGEQGDDGAPGVGVPTGGTTGQALVKASNTDYDTEWASVAGGGGFSTDSDSLISAFEPLAWYKADTGVLNSTPAAASNNDGVDQWSDQSGNGYHLRQTTSGNRPLFKTAIQNGLPVVRFDGTDDYLFGSTFPTIDLKNFTVIAVAKSSSTANFQRVMVIGASGSGNDYDDATRLEFDAGESTGSVIWRMQGGTSSEFISSISGTRPSPFAVYSARVGDRVGLVKKNAAVDGNKPTSTSITTSPTGLLLGCAYISSAIASTTAPFNGDFAELVIFDRFISDGAADMIACALRKKWAL